MLAIINDVPDLTRSWKRGRLILESIPFLLRNALDEVVTLRWRTPPTIKGLEQGTLNIKMMFRTILSAITLRPQQIITNLVGNAINGYRTCGNGR